MLFLVIIFGLYKDNSEGSVGVTLAGRVWWGFVGIWVAVILVQPEAAASAATPASLLIFRFRRGQSSLGAKVWVARSGAAKSWVVYLRSGARSMPWSLNRKSRSSFQRSGT